MSEPIVTILMPVYNATKYIDGTIKSILKQTESNFKVLIIDDCSQDETYEYLKQKLKNDSRFEILKNDKNIGLGKMRDLLISKCTTKYFMFLDDDDYLYKNSMKKMIKLAKKTDADLISSQYKMKFTYKKLSAIILPPFYKWINIKNSQDFLSGNITFFWGHFIKKVYYDSLNLSCDVKYFEDVYPTVKLFLFPKKYVHANIFVVRYLRRQNSLSNYSANKLEERLFCIGQEYTKACRLIFNSDREEKWLKKMIDHKMYQYLWVLILFYKKLNKKDKLIVINHANTILKNIADEVKWKPRFTLTPWKMVGNFYKKLLSSFKNKI
ncbi:glycosyltransferase family 2 protein [Mycoplasma elephantis]|uniref:glycosyltransferase family 2 protein n=1 Tax=Mycoplasma elephantis TaxID=114882 RepID=UPI000AFAEBA0|nr:glycosyltransferase family 2 protein [Mycoplasma elephantis]